MAHYAKLDENNIVIEVNVVDNSQEEALGSEEATVAWLKEGWGGNDWKKTSYNTAANQHPSGTPFRKNYAGVGSIYDETRDAFMAPQPFPSWLLNEDTCRWESPVPYPEETDPIVFYYWDEDVLNWVEEV